jgi:hypothetical protein
LHKVHYINADFSESNFISLHDEIVALKGNKSSMILIKGVLFFLTKQQTNRLFHLFNELHHIGDLIGSVSFPNTLVSTAAFQRLINFFGKHISAEETFQYQTIEDEFYQNMPNHTLVDHQDFFSVAQVYCPEYGKVDANEILNEHMYLLRKE